MRLAWYIMYISDIARSLKNKHNWYLLVKIERKHYVKNHLVVVVRKTIIRQRNKNDRNENS